MLISVLTGPLTVIGGCLAAQSSGVEIAQQTHPWVSASDWRKGPRPHQEGMGSLSRQEGEEGEEKEGEGGRRAQGGCCSRKEPLRQMAFFGLLSAAAELSAEAKAFKPTNNYNNNYKKQE